MKNSSNYVVGLFLVAFGLLWIIGNFIQQFSIWSLMWPTFILMPGLLLFSIWVNQRNNRQIWGMLIPATILISLAVLFYFNMFVTVIFHYGLIWAWTSFGYTGSVAVAFFICYLITKRKGLLTVAQILGIITTFILITVWFLLFLFVVLPYGLAGKLWPIILIFFGIILLVQKGVWSLFERNGKYFGRTEAEWKKWGEGFGESIRKTFEDK